jgi:hypothetical protein
VCVSIEVYTRAVWQLFEISFIFLCVFSFLFIDCNGYVEEFCENNKGKKKIEFISRETNER